MKKALLALVFGVAAMLGSAVQAAVLVYSGDTTGAPTFNRPMEDLSGLSSVGTAVPYQVQSFSVDTTATYTFTSSATFDNFFGLYEGLFDASTPLHNVLKYNDDLLGPTSAGFTFTLNAGIPYYAVMTGFANTDFGQYGVSIAGPGNFTLLAPTPEPASWAMMITGVGLAGFAVRRHARKVLIVVS